MNVKWARILHKLYANRNIYYKNSRKIRLEKIHLEQICVSLRVNFQQVRQNSISLIEVEFKDNIITYIYESNNRGCAKKTVVTWFLFDGRWWEKLWQLIMSDTAQRVAIYYYLVTRYVIIIIIIAEDVNECVAARLKLSYKFRILMILSG